MFLLHCMFYSCDRYVHIYQADRACIAVNVNIFKSRLDQIDLSYIKYILIY